MPEKPVAFANRKNEKLVGILHLPDDNLKKKIGVILLPAGLVYRIGPHRLYVEMARYLCERGYYVLRLDTAGIGGSEDELSAEKLNAHYLAIQHGKYVEDTIDSIRFLKQACNLEQIVLSGLCGGAITALLAAEPGSGGVDGLILLGLPILFVPSKNSTNQINSNFAAYTFKGYVLKIFDLNSWRQFITLQTDFNLLWNSFIGIFKTGFLKRHENTHPLLNSSAISAFKHCVANNKQVLFAFGQNDKYYWEFDAELTKKHLKQNNVAADKYEIFLVENANHSFSKREWKQLLFEKCCDWLGQYY